MRPTVSCRALRLTREVRRSPRVPQPARRSQRAAARAPQPACRSRHTVARRPLAEHTSCPCPLRARRRDEHTSGGSQCTCCFVSVARRVGGLASVVAAHTGVGAATCGRTAEQVCGAVGRGSLRRQSSSQQQLPNICERGAPPPPADLHARTHARTPCTHARPAPALTAAPTQNAGTVPLFAPLPPLPWHLTLSASARPAGV